MAEDIGEKKALEVFLYLRSRVFQVAGHCSSHRSIWFSDKIEEVNFDVPKENIKIQSGKDLGEKMNNAFLWGFDKGFQKIILIGTDCFGLTTDIVEDAFGKLQESDTVFGPANDGGYYLVGLKEPCEDLFLNKSWSHDKVLKHALSDLEGLNRTYDFVEQLIDIDTMDDLNSSGLTF